MDTQSNSWTAKQAYGLAIICLAIGIIAGYLAHAPKAPSTAYAPAASPVAAVAASPVAPVSTPNPTPEQMKDASAHATMPVLEQLKSDPKNFKLLVAAGELYYHHKSFAEASQYYERALAVTDDVAVRNQYASALFYGGKPDAAFDQYSLVLKKSPSNDIALFNSGMICYKAKHDAKAAVVFWTKLLKASPNHPNRDQVQHMIEKASQQQG